MIIQHESFNGLEDVEDTQIELNLADWKRLAYSKGKGSSTGNGNPNKSCTLCGKNGHTIEVCYRKEWLPTWFQISWWIYSS
jgi:hypothetical protein